MTHCDRRMVMRGDFKLPTRRGNVSVSLLRAAAAAELVSRWPTGLTSACRDAICFPSLQEYHARLTTASPADQRRLRVDGRRVAGGTDWSLESDRGSNSLVLWFGFGDEQEWGQLNHARCCTAANTIIYSYVGDMSLDWVTRWRNC